MIHEQIKENMSSKQGKEISQLPVKSSTMSNGLIVLNMEGRDGAENRTFSSDRFRDTVNPGFSFKDVNNHYCSGKRAELQGHP